MFSVEFFLLTLVPQKCPLQHFTMFRKVSLASFINMICSKCPLLLVGPIKFKHKIINEYQNVSSYKVETHLGHAKVEY